MKGLSLIRRDISTEDVKRFVGEGNTIKETAKRFKCSTQTISRILKGERTKRRKGGIVRGGRKVCQCCRINYVPTVPIRGHILTCLCEECWTKGGYTVVPIDNRCYV